MVDSLLLSPDAMPVKSKKENKSVGHSAPAPPVALTPMTMFLKPTPVPVLLKVPQDAPVALNKVSDTQFSPMFTITLSV